MMYGYQRIKCRFFSFHLINFQIKLPVNGFKCCFFFGIDKGLLHLTDGDDVKCIIPGIYCFAGARIYEFLSEKPSGQKGQKIK